MAYEITAGQVGGFCSMPVNGAIIGQASLRPPAPPDNPLTRAPIALVVDWQRQQAIESGPWARVYAGYPPLDARGQPTQFRATSVPAACLSVPWRRVDRTPTDAQPSIWSPYPVPMMPTPENLAYQATMANDYKMMWRPKAGGGYESIWVPTACLRMRPPIEI